MESVNTTQQAPGLHPQSHSKQNILLIVPLVFILGGAGGYCLGSKLGTKRMASTFVRPTQTNTTDLRTKISNNITYLMKYQDAGPEKEKTIFITKDITGESLKIADINMTEASTKTLLKFEYPAAVGFNPPFHIVNDFIIAPIAGADANDILIFTLTGDVISKGTREGNPELGSWIVSYDERVEDDIIKVKLFQIDNSIGTAQIDLTTGKMIPGSYENLGKL